MLICITYPSFFHLKISYDRFSNFLQCTVSMDYCLEQVPLMEQYYPKCHLCSKCLQQFGFFFLGLYHCVKSVLIRSFFWSVFSRIQSEYMKIQTRKNFVFGHLSCSVCLSSIFQFIRTLYILKLILSIIFSCCHFCFGTYLLYYCMVI